jgi:hypothetical protein
MTAKNEVTLPINVQRHFDLMMARPDVHKVMELAGVLKLAVATVLTLFFVPASKSQVAA